MVQNPGNTYQVVHGIPSKKLTPRVHSLGNPCGEGTRRHPLERTVPARHDAATDLCHVVMVVHYLNNLTNVQLEWEYLHGRRAEANAPCPRLSKMNGRRVNELSVPAMLVDYLELRCRVNRAGGSAHGGSPGERSPSGKLHFRVPMSPALVPGFPVIQILQGTTSRWSWNPRPRIQGVLT